MNCIFCDIVERKAQASIIYEDEIVIAFMDIRPVTAGHLLVIPKKHASFLREMDEETGSHLFRISMRLAEALYESGLRCEGVNIFLADGEAAFQEIFHAHMHVIPRFAGDGFRIEVDWSKKPSREELDENASRIGNAYRMQKI